MTNNPFHGLSDDAFQGPWVRVHANDTVYEGWVRIRSYHEPALLLYDAVRADGERVGEVLLYDIDAIERGEQDITIETVAVDTLQPAPHSQRQYETEDFAEFVRTVRTQGHLESFPLVRPAADGTFEIVSGHKRVAAAQEAGLESIPVRLRDLDDWTAVTIFLDEHAPFSADEAQQAVSDPTSGLYEQAELEAALSVLQDDWTDEQLREHPALDWYLGADAPYPGSQRDGADSPAGERESELDDGDGDSGTEDDEATDAA